MSEYRVMVDNPAADSGNREATSISITQMLRQSGIAARVNFVNNDPLYQMRVACNAELELVRRALEKIFSVIMVSPAQGLWIPPYRRISPSKVDSDAEKDQRAEGAGKRQPADQA